MSNRNNKMQAILNSLNANICLLDEKGYIEEVNKSWEQFAKDNGINPEKVGPGVNYIDVCERAEGNEKDSARQFARGIRAVINGETDFFELEYPCHSPETERWFVGRVSNDELKEKFYQSMKYSDVTFETYHCRKDGTFFPIEVSLRYSDLPYEKWFVVTSRNISERKKAEEKLLYLSYHDNLTGLYNRSFLEEEKKRLDVNRNLPISVIMADVNGLKLVNDTYGHKVGDELLVRAGEILKKTCRKDDIIVRWGGDEFVVFLPWTDKEEAKEILRRIKNESENFQVESLPVKIALGSATKRNIDESLEDAFKRAEDRMYQNKLTESNSARSNIISALLGTLKEKSDETEEHAWRMTELSFKFGEVLDLCAEDLDKLSLLATMHDIGKVVIPEEVLKKPGKLTKDEWEKIKEHPETGQRIARTSESLIYISEEILSHHERWDGKGYPYGLKGEEIPYLARIISIIDAYDVMTNGRSYKKRMSKEEALEEIKACARTQFDPNLAVAFEKMMR